MPQGLSERLEELEGSFQSLLFMKVHAMAFASFNVHMPECQHFIQAGLRLLMLDIAGANAPT